MENTLEQNRISEYFKSIAGAWNAKEDGDLATRLFSYLGIENDNPELPFSRIAKKFFLRTVRCAIDKTFVNDKMLVIVGKEMARKTTFIRSLIESDDLIAFDSPSHIQDEITYSILASRMLWAMDELDSIPKSFNYGNFVYWLTMQNIKYRFPYQEKESYLPRTCSLIGACNKIPAILLESRRVIPFTLKSGIPTDKTDKINKTKFWSQLYNQVLDSTITPLEWTKQELDYFEKLRNS